MNFIVIHTAHIIYSHIDLAQGPFALDAPSIVGVEYVY